MKKWKHINLEQRKIITSGFAHKSKLKNIGDLLQLDPTGIPREVKKNRTIINQ